MSPGAVAQRRQPDRDDVDAEVEVLAEAARLHLGLEVPVGGADQAHVDPDRLGAAHRADLAVLQGAQQLGLHARAPCPRSRRGTGCRRRPARTGPRLAATAPVKAPRAWPNSSDSSSDSDSAVQLTGTKGRVARRGVRVDGARHQLLAGARLAHHQHRGAGGRHPGHQLVDVEHARRSCPRSRPAARRRRRPPRPPAARPSSRRRSSARVTVRRSSSTLKGLET